MLWFKGLSVGDGLRGLGAIEGNVDKLIADRMKKRGMSLTKRGMSLTKRGANRMARLINLRERGNLNTCVKYQNRTQHIPSRESDAQRRSISGQG